MQRLEQTYAKWRNTIMKVNIYLVAFAFIMESIMFFVLREENLVQQPLKEYFKWFLVIPTVVNLINILIGQLVLRYLLKDSKWSNYVPVVQLAIICTVLASIHNIFSITLCFFCFPLFVSAIFGDRKIVRHIAVLNLLLLSITLLYRKFAIYKPENDEYFLAEALVTLAILAATIALSEMMIGFQSEKTHFINEAFFRQIEMQDQLNKDQKTGLYGQTIFINTLKQIVDMRGTSIQLAMIDIDDFKKINDTYGHLKGDQIIQALTGLMKELFQQQHFISRYGGEEFTIIFTGSELQHSVELLNKLRIAFEKRRYNFMESGVTISIGVAECEDGWTAETLFEAADSAMYTSKMNGKNCVMVYDINDWEKTGIQYMDITNKKEFIIA